MYKKYKRSARSADYFKYVAARNHYNRCCKVAYRNHLSLASYNVKNNAKSFWDFVNSKRKAWKHPTCVSFNGCRSETDYNTCEMFASFFKSVYSTADSSLLDFRINTVGYDVSMSLIYYDLIKVVSANLKSSYKCALVYFESLL